MNNDPWPTVLVMLIVAVVVVILSRYSSGKSNPETQRRNDLAALAKKFNLEFSPNADFKLAQKYAVLGWLRRGEARYAYNIFRGNHLECPVTIFDYHFSTPGGKGGYDYYWSAYVVEMKSDFPDMMISHESLEARFAEVLGESHITLESTTFSHSFRVRSADKKFAFEVCHPKMMEYLLANKDLTIEIYGTAVAMLFEDWLRPQKIEYNLSRLIEIRKLLPEYLFANA